MVISWMFHGPIFPDDPGGGDGQEGAFNLRIQSGHEGGWIWQSSMEKHRKTYGKDREHPLKARDFHIYVSLDGSELLILNYLVRALVQTQFLRTDGMQKVEASTSRLGYSSKLPGFWNVFVVENIKR